MWRFRRQWQGPPGWCSRRIGPVTSASGSTTPSCQPAPIDIRAATVLAVGIGHATSDASGASVASAGVGGVILLGANVVDADQVPALIDGLRRQSPHGLLVMAAEEGGPVSRWHPIIGPTPSARVLGRQPLAAIAAVGAERCATLQDFGFDLVLASVPDADGGPAGGAIGDRAFGATPAEAGPRAGAFAEGLRRAGVAAAAKHFPGQGGLADSHDGQVVVHARLDELRTAGALAFRPVIDAGAEAIMMSHVTFSALGSRGPRVWSPPRTGCCARWASMAPRSQMPLAWKRSWRSGPFQRPPFWHLQPVPTWCLLHQGTRWRRCAMPS